MPTKKRRKAAIIIALLGLALAAGLAVAKWNSVTDWVASTDLGARLTGVDPDLVAANNQFAFDIYAQLSKADANDNIFFSPLSISTILAQTYAGARGNTAKEMKEALHFDLDPAKLHPAMGSLLQHLERVGTKGDNQLSIANALWVEQTCTLLPDFVAIGKDHYRAAPRSVDFKHAAEAQRKTINDWVEDHTHGKITDLMPPDSVDADSRLVLTNAVYFDGHWETVFQPRWTSDDLFKLADGQSIKVPMMSQLEKFKYMEQEDLQALEMPYAGLTLSMVILLPRKLDGLADLEKNLTAGALASWTSRLQKQKVVVMFPRFTMKTTYQLTSALQSLGLRDAFSPKAADFSGMSSSPIFVDVVLHKAFVEVNEKGTEAAAATAVSTREAGKSAHQPPKPPVFRADHPFIFLIRDVHSGSILFLGRVTNPKV